jgi:hypothetical protein
MDTTAKPTESAEPTEVGLPAEPFVSYRKPLERAAELALSYIEGLPERHVGVDAAAPRRPARG